MNKFTKIIAAVVAVSAVLSFAGCGNKNESSASDSSSSSASESVAATAESAASSAEAAVTAEADAATVQADAATAEADASATVQAPVTAEAETGADVMDVTKMFGTWSLAGIDDGTGIKDVATYAADNATDVESIMIFVNIDENGYTSAAAGTESTYTYTATDYGMLVAVESVDLGVVYDEESDSIAYGVSVGDKTVKFIFTRYDAE